MTNQQIITGEIMCLRRYRRNDKYISLFMTYSVNIWKTLIRLVVVATFALQADSVTAQNEQFSNMEHDSESLTVDDLWTFGLIPVAPTALVGLLWDEHDESQDFATGHGGLMATGIMVRWERPTQIITTLLGLEFSACGVGGILDSALDLGDPNPVPGFYFRFGGGIRWRIPILDPYWHINLGINGGLFSFVVPSDYDHDETGVQPMFGGLGFYINPLAVGMEWTLPDTRWTIGFRIEVLELGVAFPIPKPSGDDPIASQYLLLSAGRTTLMATVFF